MRPLPFYTHRRAPLTAMSSDLDRPLCELTVRPPDWAVLHDGDDGICFRHDPDPRERSAS